MGGMALATRNVSIETGNGTEWVFSNLFWGATNPAFLQGMGRNAPRGSYMDMYIHNILLQLQELTCHVFLKFPETPHIYIYICKTCHR